MAGHVEEHIVKRYDEEIAHLRSLVLEMGGLVEEQIQNAIKAFEEEDLDLAREIIGRDHLVNRLEIKSDEEVVRIVALRQPMAGDLRLIMSLGKVVTDLERIGDEARKIARMAIHISERDAPRPKHKLVRDVQIMGKLAASMLHDSLDAFVRMDVETALQVAQGDAELDHEFQAALRRMVTYIMEDTRIVGHAIDIVFVIKALERIGDHSKNISEYVVYLVKGKDIRHVDPNDIAEDILRSP